MKLSNRGKHRLFFALEFSDELCQQLTHYSQLFEGRVVPAENLHLTSLFVGEIDNHQVFDLVDSIAPPEIAPFDLSFGSYGFIIKLGVLYLGVSKGADSLEKLHQSLKQQTRNLSFVRAEKRAYLPHVTLVRDALPPHQLDAPKFADVRVDRFGLYESLPTKHGVHYECLHEWPLRTRSLKQRMLGRH